MVDWSQIRASILGEAPEKELLPDVKLPILPRAVNEFCARAEDDDCSMKELAEIVEKDAGLTCQLLKNVNASANGLKHRVATVQHAISSLGIRNTRLLLIGAAMQSAMPATQLKLMNMSAFSNANLERACLARRFARMLKTDQELAFSAGLLQDFLLPVLTNQLDEKYVKFLGADATQNGDLIEFEQQTFGWNHAEAGARVMFDWKFPDDLICCVLMHHRGLSVLADKNLGKSAAAAVALAGLMPDTLLQFRAGLTHLKHLSDMWSPFELGPVAEEIDEECRDQFHNGDSHIPFRERCARFLKSTEEQTAEEQTAEEQTAEEQEPAEAMAV